MASPYPDSDVGQRPLGPAFRHQREAAMGADGLADRAGRPLAVRRLRRSTDLLWLIRWLVLLLLLLDVLRYAPMSPEAPTPARIALGVIVITVVVNLLLRRLGLRLRSAAGERRLALLGVIIDLALVTGFVVLFAGGTSTPELLYSVVIAEAAVAFGLAGALAVGGTASAALLATYLVLTRVQGATWASSQPWFLVSSLLLVAVTVGLLAEWLVREQTKLDDALRHREQEVRWRQGLLDMLAHDLRSPMAAAASSAALVAARGGVLPGEQVAALAQATQRQVNRALRLLDDLLDLGRARAGVLEVHRAPVDLAAFVRQILAELPERFSAHTTLDVPGGEALVADADPARLAQVLWNLLTNAEKHGAPPVTIRIGRGGADTVLLEVLDRGPGVPDELEHELFEPYRTGGGEGSTGLGLWISRMLVDAQGGELTYDRENGTTRFVVRLGEAGTSSVRSR